MIGSAKRRRKPFWVKRFGKDKICTISRTRLRPGKNKDGLLYTVFLKCGHGFCRKALVQWALKKRTCPNCRKRFDIIELFIY